MRELFLLLKEEVFFFHRSPCPNDTSRRLKKINIFRAVVIL